MACKPLRTGLFVVVLLTGGFAAPAWAQNYSAAQMLTYRPKMPGVNYTTPAEQEMNQCKVETVRSQATGKSMGWKVVDPRGQVLRAFLDTNGDNKIDVWSYYK